MTDLEVASAWLGSPMGPTTVDSEKLEHGPGRNHAGFPSSLGFGVGGPSHSNLLGSTVRAIRAQ